MDVIKKYSLFTNKNLKQLKLVPLFASKDIQNFDEEVFPESNDGNCTDEEFKASSCFSCDFDFTTRNEQINHYKSDWHRYNVKLKLRHRAAVSEEFFNSEVIQNSDLSSISGSEDSDVESLSTSVNHVAIDSCGTVNRRSPKLHFEIVDTQNVLSVHRCLIANKKEILGSNQMSRAFRAILDKEGFYTLIVMIAGGHFAAAVFKNEEVVVHKTFHKYVVRAKQGTSQSSSDSRGSKAKSAGANLRRHCEASLKEDIINLFKSWSSYIKNVNVILTKASGDVGSILFSGKTSCFDKKDPRLRSIPFPTRRPTFSEIQRVFSQIFLVTEISKDDFLVKSTVEELKLETTTNKERSNLESKKDLEEYSSQETLIKSCETVKKIEASSTENQICSDSNTSETDSDTSEDDESESRFLFEKLKTLYAEDTEQCFQLLSDNIDILRTETIPDDGGSCLHLFSKLNDCRFIEFLLKQNFDVCLRNDRNKTPCQLVTQKKARNVFRRFRAKNPDAFDYINSGIPDALDQEAEKVRFEKMAQKRKENKVKKKEELKVEREKQEMLNVERKQKQEFLNLSDREKRALITERRLGMASAMIRCFQCGTNIESLVPFKYEDFSFCSTDCVWEHRKKANNK